jgi:hypothetical protein
MPNKLKNLYAHAAIDVPFMPPYISVNVTGDNTVTVSVRSHVDDGGEHAKIHLTFEQWQALKSSPDPENIP